VGGFFIRQFNDWELDMVASKLGSLYSNTLSSAGPDRMRWSLRGNWVLDIWSYNGVLRVPRELFSMERNFVYQSPEAGSFLNCWLSVIFFGLGVFLFIYL
jgi:hypothetical protein